ncbi:vitamin K-dependent gamma-carboxylase-like [Amphiura filiformis]|uniref:vitamin K-dependent gamma-carboxylase-like n=1 Tax=Amphiura filiformis TaxID=82378 RepID=UPI003B21D4E0
MKLEMRRRQTADVKTGNHGDLKEESRTDKMDTRRKEGDGRLKSLLGFDPLAITGWTSLVRLLNEPRDPAGLAVTRILFGILMMVDIPQERGMANVDSRFSDEVLCRFPLFSGLEPLPVDWMYLVYLVMFCGAVGICLGLFYRYSCALFFIPYWYIFFLDKSAWNNHSYLYGLLGFQLTWLDANRCWSLDALRNPKVRNKHIPLWNYTMLRTQIFIVYFLAGLKKLDRDWMSGYSMNNLSKSWVFDPFKLLLTDDQIDLYIVHIGGLTLDLFSGFLMFFDKTRPFVFFFVGSFHTMNSQLFSIGMFPYAMLATMPIFCYVDWPRKLIAKMPTFIKGRFVTEYDALEQSEHCIYPEDKQTVEKTKETQGVEDVDKDQSKKLGKTRKPSERSWYHHIASCWLILYLSFQFFMPYSHFITQGYNNWTNGLYGYSWDMMVHSWATQHIKIKFVDSTGETGYLDPKYFTNTRRWASHPDMVKQYAMCIADNLQDAGLNEVELYFDIWKSMNDRFHQRMVHPLGDMVKAEWSPFQYPEWNMPLLTEFSDWRTQLKKTEDELGENIDVTFVADFPGLFLENYLNDDFDNCSITVLSGKVKVELVDNGTFITLNEGEKLQLPIGAFHNVHVVSKEPSTYMYLFVNGTNVEYQKNITNALESVGGTLDDLKNGQITDPMIANITDEKLAIDIRDINSENQKHSRSGGKLSLANASKFLEKKAKVLRLTVSKTSIALGHVLFGYESVMESVKRDMESKQGNSGSQTRVSA